MDYSGNGYIKVRVTSVGGTVPTAGAKVVISEYCTAGMGEDEVLFTLRTNASGNTPTVMLPAPRMAESMSPGGDRAYSLYAIRVTADGYYPVELSAVPVFDGVTSIQSVDLIPIGAGDVSVDRDDGEVVIYETPEGGYPGKRNGQERDDIGNMNGMMRGDLRVTGAGGANEQ